jgi:xanthine dehydrogenase accessory factor
MIGSKRKIKMIFDDLVNEGNLRRGAGGSTLRWEFDIGSQTVPEIAVSIVAELIACRNLGGRVPGRPRGVELK